MRLIVRFLIPVLATTLALLAPAAAAAPPPPPPQGFDPQINCVNRETLVAVDKPLPSYPSSALEEWSEGLVLFMVTVAEDGSVHDPVTLDLVGAPAFRDAAARAVLKWRYQPYLHNGRPATFYGARIEVLYLMSPSDSRATHERFIGLYRRAHNRIEEKKYDEAIALLDKAQHDQLNHYEQALGSFALALVANETGDWRRALYNIRHATLKDARFLDKETARIALRLQVFLEAQDGALEDAACTFQVLKAIDPAVVTNEGAGALVAKIVTALNSPAPLVVEGVVYADPGRSLAPAWQHKLMRPKFAFAAASPAVKSFRLVCKLTVLEEKVSEEMQWAVPEDASPCTLFVFGDPGATVKLIEEW